MNVAEIEDAVSRLAEAPFDPDTFFFQFMAAYGATQTTITRLKGGETNHSDITGAWLWRLNAHAGIADKADAPALRDRLKASPSTSHRRARFVIATDGDEIAAEDLRTGETLNCPLADLDDHFSFFLPLAGFERYRAADENPVDIRATARLARLYDTLIADNPSWAGDVHRHATNQFMARVIFCLFAEDTGIFADNLFSQTLHDLGGQDGANAQNVLETLFRAMATPHSHRDGMPAWATALPYVNGGLFAGPHDAPSFTRTSYRYLLDSGGLDWRQINPDIFGSMIQAIVDPESRAHLGMHYTSVPNILRVLDPLFLDDLRHQLRKAWDSPKRLRTFMARLERIRIFDPACGSGNFLVIAYRELRTLETEALARLAALTGKQSENLFSRVSLSNFYGIEVADFAVETAKLSLWVAEYQMNKRLEAAIGRGAPDLPLRESGNVVCDNALRTPWADVCPHARDSDIETYLVGNPPYLGHSERTPEQREDTRRVFQGRLRHWGKVDYVGCWFLLAADYCRGRNAAAAFVATSSVCQGEQVPVLWPHVLSAGIEIGFAHTPFKWANNAAHNAGVTCAVVGLRNEGAAPKRLITGEVDRRASNITPYLVEGPTVYVTKRARSICGLPQMLFGNMPRDGGYLLMNKTECDDLLAREPEAARFVRPFVGSNQFIHGHQRYCIWVPDDEAEEAWNLPLVGERLRQTRNFRLDSRADSTQSFARRAHRFVQIQGVAQDHAILVPRHSGEHRPYLPVGLLTNSEIVSDSALAIYDAPVWTLALIASRLHLVWIAAVCGKLEGRFRYSNTLGWHTFPAPALSEADRAELTRTAEAILDAREAHFPATIAELYDPDEMPEDLARAHRDNDAVVERIFAGSPFGSDDARREHLFARYTEMAGVGASAREATNA